MTSQLDRPDLRLGFKMRLSENSISGSSILQIANQRNH